MITTNRLLFLIGLLLFSCGTNNELHLNKDIPYSDEFYKYLVNNNINKFYSIDNSKYTGSDYFTSDLSKEQKNKLLHFIEVFQSSDKYIKYINYENLAKYDMKKIYLQAIDVIGFNNIVQYGIDCVFYSKNKIQDHSIFDEKENLWYTFNMALYHVNNGGDIEFDYWRF